MESKVQAFYKNKTIFITGGSGFLGRMIIEKLLRSTEVKRIYVLIRPKRGQDIQTRLSAWNSTPLFESLLKSNPKAFERITLIAGDCEQADLGISEADRKLLLKEVQVVVHSAASVNFTEPLNVALNTNTRSPRLMLQLAKQMRQLEAFVHVSTAYSNCVVDHIRESFYPDNLSCSYDNVLHMSELLGKNLLDSMAPTLIGKYPNTYTFTKALGEQVMQMEAGEIPVCIIRPGMILSTYKEPLPGWSDNLYGPVSILYGVAFGVLRLMFVDKTVRANIVPVDYCANLTLASAWQTAVEAVERKKLVKSKSPLPAVPPTIYNYAPTEQNGLLWRNFHNGIEKRRHIYPLENMIWYPFLDTTSNYWVYSVALYFYHLLPGLLIDLVLRLRGQKPKMIKTYNKIHENVKKLSKFSLTNWTFEMGNSERLAQNMTPEDRKLFPFDMSRLSWNSYIDVVSCGVRKFLAKETMSEESLQQARKHLKRLLIYHRLMQLSVCSFAGVFIWWLGNRMFSLF